MDRMSARYIGITIGKNTQWVYEAWKTIGLVTKDKFGDWTLTDYGRQVGGKMSRSNYLSVPTFEYDAVKKLMQDFINDDCK